MFEGTTEEDVRRGKDEGRGLRDPGTIPVRDQETPTWVSVGECGWVTVTREGSEVVVVSEMSDHPVQIKITTCLYYDKGVEFFCLLIFYENRGIDGDR